MRFLDANIVLRYLLRDSPEQAERARALIHRIRDGAEQVYMPDIALADVVWTLHRFYKRTRQEIRDVLLPILKMDGLRMHDKATAVRAVLLFADLGIDFSDALIAAEMLRSGREEIYSYDRDFDRVPGLRRVEP
ncbi:MAG TPA: type II toxin-antitoxin system VapC family toxin [Chloroflexi bacterium]|nr:type II toxin-antitoxin system VapC family toxin [Chloroflexota bacterium]